MWRTICAHSVDKVRCTICLSQSESYWNAMCDCWCCKCEMLICSVATVSYVLDDVLIGSRTPNPSGGHQIKDGWVNNVLSFKLGKLGSWSQCHETLVPQKWTGALKGSEEPWKDLKSLYSQCHVGWIKYWSIKLDLSLNYFYAHYCKSSIKFIPLFLIKRNGSPSACGGPPVSALRWESGWRRHGRSAAAYCSAGRTFPLRYSANAKTYSLDLTRGWQLYSSVKSLCRCDFCDAVYTLNVHCVDSTELNHQSECDHVEPE